MNYRETHSTEREIKDHSDTEDTLNNKELEGSAAENLKCLYLRTGYFVQPKNFMAFYLMCCEMSHFSATHFFGGISILKMPVEEKY